MAFEKLSRFLGMGDDEYEDEDDYSDSVPVDVNDRPQTDMTAVRGQKVVAMKSAPATLSKIIIFEPRIYSDAKEVGSHLLNNKAVLINFSRIDDQQAKRIVDFLTGTVFAINGEIQRVGDQIFICTPPNFEIDGSLSDALGQDDFNQLTR